MKKQFQKFRAYLRARKLRLTRTRELIYQEICSSSAVHANAYEIHGRLKKKGYDVSLATIYRTLHLLVQARLVSAIDLGEDHSHYEPEMVRAGHGHFICLACGKVKEFSHKKIQGEIGRIGRDNHFQLEKFSVQVFGFCQDCNK